MYIKLNDIFQNCVHSTSTLRKWYIRVFGKDEFNYDLRQDEPTTALRIGSSFTIAQSTGTVIVKGLQVFDVKSGQPRLPPEVTISIRKSLDNAQIQQLSMPITREQFCSGNA